LGAAADLDRGYPRRSHHPYRGSDRRWRRQAGRYHLLYGPDAADFDPDADPAGQSRRRPPAGSEQPVNAERLNRWRDLVGEDRWFEDTNGWRFVGLNSLLLGHEDDEEQAQFEWLRETLEERRGRRIALFAHKPLFVDEPHEGDTGYWSVRPAQRKRLYDLIAAHDVALFASGHLHWAWQGRFENTALTWAPSAAFILDKLVREMPGERLVGAVVHEFGDDVQTDIVAVPGMTAYVLDDVIEEVYPTSANQTESVE
jgi:alkaline phosphatase D